MDIHQNSSNKGKKERERICCLPKQIKGNGDQPKGEKEAKEGEGKEWGSKRSADGRKRQKASKQTCRRPPVREGNQEPRQFQQHRSEHDPPRSGQRWKDGGIIHHQKGSP